MSSDALRRLLGVARREQHGFSRRYRVIALATRKLPSLYWLRFWGVRMDRIISMEIFVRVVELGGLRAAAEATGISATMAGNHLQALETRLGAKLLNRTTRRQSLTEIGSAYYSQCLDVLSRIESAENAAREMHQQPRGRLRISAPTTLGTHLLAPKFVDYLRQYKEIEIDLQLNDRIVDLAEEGFDVAFRFGILPDSGLVSRSLRSPSRVLCASPEYLSQRGIPEKPADLAGHNCLAFQYITAEREWRFGDDRSHSVRVSGQFTVNSGLALLQVALGGLGIAMLPDYLVEPEVQAGRLVRLFSNFDLSRAPLQLVYLPDRQMTPKMRSFVDFVMTSFGGAQ